MKDYSNKFIKELEARMDDTHNSTDVTNAVDCLHSAMERLYEVGLDSSADLISEFLVKIANDKVDDDEEEFDPSLDFEDEG